MTTYYVPQLQETSVLSARTDVNLLNDLAVIAIRNKDYRKAKKLLDEMGQEDRELFLTYPIYNLLYKSYIFLS